MQKNNTVTNFLPKWTKRSITDSRGRDPLGLSRVSNIITDFLLTGIITQTYRARYYSFYSWSIWHIHETEQHISYPQFVESFQRRESILALATIASDDTSPVGVDAARPKLEHGESTGKLSCDFRVLPSNSLGGYGQYYGGSLVQLGLIEKREDGVSIVNKGPALDLAKAYHQSIKTTPYIKKSCYLQSTIALKEFNASKKKISLKGIKRKSGEKERKLLIKLFFGFLADKLDERAMLRRQTLGHILFVVNESSKLQHNISLKELDTCLVHYPYYFSLLKIEKKAGEYVCPDNFVNGHTLWRQFSLQHFFTQAIESLFFSILEIIGTEPLGFTTTDTVRVILADEGFFNALKEATNNKINSPKDLLNSLGVFSVPDHDKCSYYQKKFLPDASINESLILDIPLKSPGVAAGRSMLLLSILYCKWRGLKDKGLTYVKTYAGKELWFACMWDQIDTWLRDISWQESLEQIMQIFLVQQHDRIMYEKGRLDSSWISSSEGKILKEQDYTPKIRSTRHQQAVEILSDLCLLHKNGDSNCLEITQEGVKMLNKLLQE